MTQMLSVNTNNDLYLGTDGNIATVNRLQAVLQACAHAAKTLLGECILNTTIGVPYFETVWNGSPNIQHFIAALRVQLQNIANVLDVISLNASIQNNQVAYTAVILTSYGQGVMNG
jgi:hypothetical protein